MAELGNNPMVDGRKSDPKADFKQLLANHRIQKSNVVIPNRFPWQTRMAVLELLNLAAKDHSEIKILSGSATEQFYSTDVLDKLQACLKEGCSGKLLIWDEKKQCGDGIESLQKQFPQQFQARFSGTRNAGDQIQHFLVVGTDAYRLEAPHAYLGNATFNEIAPETKAKICFNDRTTGEALAKSFDGIWNVVGKFQGIGAA